VDKPHFKRWASGFIKNLSTGEKNSRTNPSFFMRYMKKDWSSGSIEG
jgi:hypothetical protein